MLGRVDTPAKSIIFDTKFFVFNTKILVFTHALTNAARTSLCEKLNKSIPSSVRTQQFCIRNDEICIKNDEFTRNLSEGFSLKIIL